jgi:hypothetical protein
MGRVARIGSRPDAQARLYANQGPAAWIKVVGDYQIAQSWVVKARTINNGHLEHIAASSGALIDRVPV